MGLNFDGIKKRTEIYEYRTGISGDEKGVFIKKASRTL